MNKICVGSPEKLEDKLKKGLHGLKEQDFLQPIKLVVPSNSWANSGQNDCIDIDDEEYSLPAIFIFGIYKLNNLQKELLKKLVSSTTVLIYLPAYLVKGGNRTKILHWLEELDLPREEVGKSHRESLLNSLQSNIGHVFSPMPFAKNTKNVKSNAFKRGVRANEQ